MMCTSLLRVGVTLLTLVYGFSSDVQAHKKVLSLRTKPSERVPSAGVKEPFFVKRGDCELTFGGKLKIEHFLQDNMYLLNTSVPDQNEYFKETATFTIDCAYGKEKYGYKAAELFADLRHKGIWARATGYADKDSGPIAPSSVKVSQSLVGSHSHVSGKSMPWFSEAWLQFSPNAAIGHAGDDAFLHQIKLGWFPFWFGRGIALGSIYGLNKEFLGVSKYGEDKGTPGIDVHGVLLKDCLEYDFYYSKFEERGKSFQDCVNFDRIHVVNRVNTPWRGVGKDNDLVGARLQWKALNETKFGTLNFEPYVFYNAASDQRVEQSVDSKLQWGSYGLSFEHTRGNFECGGEVAFNYGKEKLFFIDRNVNKITNVDGSLVEQFTHILLSDPTVLGANPAKALVTTASKKAEKTQDFTGRTAAQLNGTQLGASGLYSAKDRFRPAYDNTFDGWMAVVDGAYNFKNWDLQIAAAYGYASGDTDPHEREVNKKYHGFVGLNEGYAGKRVASVLMMDERLLKRPLPLAASDSLELSTDITFSNLQHAGLGVTWKPKLCIKDLSLNPNVIGFWATKPSQRFIANASRPHGGDISSTETARSFLGTEFNLLSSCSMIKDLKFFAHVAFFMPGSYFTDMKGLRLDDAYFKVFADDIDNEYAEQLDFTLGNNNAFHMNIGLEYKF